MSLETVEIRTNPVLQILGELRKPKQAVLFSEVIQVNEGNIDNILKLFSAEPTIRLVNQERKQKFLDVIRSTKLDQASIMTKAEPDIHDALEYLSKNKDKLPLEILIIGYETEAKSKLDNRFRADYLGSTITAQSVLMNNGYRADIESIILAGIVNKTNSQEIIGLRFPEGKSIEFSIYVLEK